MKRIKMFFKKLNKKGKILFLLLIVLVVSPIVFTSSKYVITKISEIYFNSKKFYFESNVLNNKTYDLYNWNGTSDYTLNVDIKNNVDDLNWCKDNITYKIESTCTSENKIIECTNIDLDILNTSSNPTINTNSIVIKKGNNTFKTGDEVKITLKATSIEPYKKVLYSTFKIHVNENKVSYNIIDTENKDYLELEITNTLEDKAIEIEFDYNKINIDNTNYFVKSGTTSIVTSGSDEIINKLQFNTKKDNVYSIRFYKKDKTKNYTLDENILTIK